jgi:hypothetical protein
MTLIELDVKLPSRETPEVRPESQYISQITPVESYADAPDRRDLVASTRDAIHVSHEYG